MHYRSAIISMDSFRHVNTYKITKGRDNLETYFHLYGIVSTFFFLANRELNCLQNWVSRVNMSHSFQETFWTGNQYFVRNSFWQNLGPNVWLLPGYPRICEHLLQTWPSQDVRAFVIPTENRTGAPSSWMGQNAKIPPSPGIEKKESLFVSVGQPQFTGKHYQILFPLKHADTHVHAHF